MGYGYSSDDGPLMCFNGPKTVQLGWFPNHVRTLTSPDYNWSGNLYHSLDEHLIPSGGMMIIKVPGFSSFSREFLDYYISFNKASGNNSGTKEAKDTVTVHSSQTDSYVSAPKSLRVAELAAGQTFEFRALGIDVVVTVDAINLSASPPYATVTIVSGTEAPSTTQSPSVSLVPSAKPSGVPSSMPSPADGISPSPTAVYYTLFTNFLSGEFYAASKGGIMFDITATEDIVITNFDLKLFYVNYPGNSFSTDVEIWTKDGTFEGYRANNAVTNAWDQHMSRTTIQAATEGDISTLGLSPLKDLMEPIYIGAGSTKGIFISNRDAVNFIEMAYSTTATDYTTDDGAFTVKRGIFQKYDKFDSSTVNDDYVW